MPKQVKKNAAAAALAHPLFKKRVVQSKKKRIPRKKKHRGKIYVT